MGDLGDTPKSVVGSQAEFERLEQQTMASNSGRSEQGVMSADLERRSSSSRRSSKQSIVSNPRSSGKIRASTPLAPASRKISSVVPPQTNSDIDRPKSPVSPASQSAELVEDSAMGNEDSLSKSVKKLSKSKQEEVSSILSQLKAIAASEKNVSDDEGSSTPKEGIPEKDGGRISGASISSHHPYNVAFESDEQSTNAIQSQNENNLVRGFRERLMKNDLVSNGTSSEGIEKFATTLAALKKRTNLETHNLENILDVWCRELRQAIVAENINVQDRILQEFDNVIKELLQSRQKDVDRLHSDIDSLHNLCRSYSKAINQRDKTIANLADALAGQKEQVVLARTFAALKTEAEESRQEKFREVIAKKYYQRILVQRFFHSWHAAVQERWRTRIEKACQKRAEEVCHQMADQYEKRIGDMEETIRKLREENKLYKKERDQVTLQARNALLHGVSVLKTEVSHFPGGSGDSSEPASRKTSKNDDPPKFPSRNTTGRTAQSSDRSNGEVISRINSIGSGPVPYAVERHFESQPNSGKSAASAKSNGSSQTKRS